MVDNKKVAEKKITPPQVIVARIGLISAVIAAVATIIVAGISKIPIPDGQIQSKISAPQFDPISGEYEEMKKIKISCNNPEAIIYYTIDKSIPTKKSIQYHEPIIVRDNSVIIAIAILGNNKSEVTTGEYIINIKDKIKEFILDVTPLE